MKTFNICIKCHKKIAISPEGLCNICDEEALLKREKSTKKEKSS